MPPSAIPLEPIEPRVWNIRDPDIPDDVVYCGRPSEYGNRFVKGRDGTREEVISKFEEWVLSQPEFVKKIKKELRGKHLSCWCKPKSCHVDILFRIANS